MQKAYISKLMELAEKDRNVLHILADSGTGYDEMFRMNFPTQMYNFGIAEENMVAAAAGMATAGKIPFVYTAGAFLVYRAYEFIRDDLCFQNLNVKVVGMGSGLAWSSLGPTHHTTEDIAVLRALPNLTIFSPSTPIQVAACVEESYRIDGPVYIRIGMNNEKEYFDKTYKLPVGKNEILIGGENITFFTTGSILEEVMDAAELLKEKNIAVNVVNVHSIKPFDEENIVSIARGSRIFFTIEEHNIYGGLGSIIDEILIDYGIGLRNIRIGLEDKFAVGYGTQKDVRRQNGLDTESIIEKVMRHIV